MPQIVLIALLVLILSGCRGQDDRTLPQVTAKDAPQISVQDTSNVYRLDLDIEPASKTISVRGTVEIFADGPTSEAAFLLNDGMEISQFQPDVAATLEVERGIVLGTYAMPNTQRLTLRFDEPLAQGDRVKIDLDYMGPIRDDSIEWGRGLISESWVELNQGSIWYPIWREEPLLRWRVSVGLPDDFEVVGPGGTTRGDDGRWVVEPAAPILGRITVAASPNFVMTTREIAPGLEARLMTPGPEPRADALLKGVRDVYAYYTELIGKPRGGTDTLTILYAGESVPVTRAQMAFATNGDYIALGVASPRDQDFLLAHEIAHFWWISGEAGTPDEFMTESLAEYVALRFGESIWGQDWLAEKLARAEAVSKHYGGSILDEGDFEGREALLYFRGPLMLYRLQKRIGMEAMDGLLMAAHAQDISRLRAFIDLIAQSEGREIANWFEDGL